MMDTIFVEHLEVHGKHGVLPHEWSHEQRFVVDMSVVADIQKSTETDSDADTINYVELCAIAHDVIGGSSVYLIERLAHQIAERILEDKRVQEVSVTIRKPSVLPSGVPGVTITRTRE